MPVETFCLLHALSLYTLRSYCGRKCFVSVVKYIFGKSTKITDKENEAKQDKQKTQKTKHLFL